MIIQLRRRHYYTWLILAFLLPVLVFLAYFNIPENAESNFKRQGILAFSTVLKSQTTEQLIVKIRSNEVQKYQLEVTILQPIAGAANQIFVSNSNSQTAKILLGSIESIGVYRFVLPKSLTKSPVFISVFDAIKHKEILKLTI